MKVDILGKVTSVHMVGESHCLGFDSLLFKPHGAAEHYVCRTCYLPSVPASQFLAGGQVSAPLVAALVKQEILDAQMKPAYLSANASAAYIAGTPVLAPVIVFFGCDTELVSRLYLQLGNTFDFELPGDTDYGVNRDKQPIAYAEVAQQIALYVNPMMAALQILQQNQLSRLLVHGLPPRNMDQAAAELNSPGPMPDVRVRSKLALEVNRQLQSACERLHIGFVDIWQETSSDGFLRQEFALDGIHLNRRAAQYSLEKIAALLVDSTRSNANGERYDKALELAQPVPVPQPELPARALHADAWAKHGLVSVRADPAMCNALAQGLQFEPGGGHAHARPDWVGPSRVGWPLIDIAKPSSTALGSARHALSQASVSSVLHAGANSALTVCSFRPIRSEMPFSPPMAAQNLTIPEGVRCAVLHLAGAAQYLFEAKTQPPQPIGVFEGAPGLLLVFDSRRVQYRVQAPTGPVDLLEIALCPCLIGQPFRVVWAGWNDWPADPFHFSVEGMLAEPPFKHSTFSARALPGVLSNSGM